MSTIVTRAGKGSPLTNNEVDANFVNLNTDKIQTLTSTDASVNITGTGSSRDLSVNLAAAGDVDGPASATDNAVTRFDGTTGKLIQNSPVTISDAGDMAGAGSLAFDGTIPPAPAPGTIWFDSSTNTWNAQQNAITQQIGEELFIYGKASAAITDTPLQIVYHTGTVGASGVITFAPTIAGITDENAIIGVATESIALNGFGRVTTFGVIHGINTTGSAFGETWVNDDVIWYNPITGNPTKVKPVAPNIKFQVGIVINAGSGGSGSFQVLLQSGSQLGGTDSNVAITSPTGEYTQELAYQASTGVWKNYTKSTSTIAEGTNLYYTDARVRLAISGSAPLAYSPSTGVFSIPAATSTANGYLTNTDWATFNGKQAFLVSGTNIKTINGSSVLGSGDLVISGGDPAGTAVAMSIALG